ncbi:MAG TPA: FlgD immunoglobulin-like domain containing protein [Candidatus Krumholzibacteria bacterium]|nr:FlgD immunoglobulin-like domain containing protein [Candidatus Krumholzibacteria bacterium]HRX50499.1 FlgD immunoglobulin-like domain containing protein [Candidatus Krumholzibacteria bacterium]
MIRRLLTLLALCAATAAAAPPDYVIVDLGLVQPGDFASQGFRVSDGGVAVGRSFGTPTYAFSWTEAGGLTGLPNLAGRDYGVANGANDSGMVVGTGATTSFGSSPLPLAWQDGVVSQLPLPPGQTLGRANAVNALGKAVGSVNGGSLERAAIFEVGTPRVIGATTDTGCFMTTAYGINDSDLIVGTGIDPANAARNVGMAYEDVLGGAWEVGALPGRNGALCFDVSDAGHVTGGSMLNQGDSTPFLWTATGGMVEIPLPLGATSGSGRGVNDDGWVVGNAGGLYAVPFLWDGQDTYRIQDLLPPGSGWDLATNTSSSALGISDAGMIVGTGVHDGAIRAYALIPDDASSVLVRPTAELGFPSPNPSNGGTSLAFRLPAARAVTLTVHDVRGRRVRTLIDGALADGDHTAVWDGRTEAGADAPAGVYFLTLRTPESVQARRVVVAR